MRRVASEELVSPNACTDWGLGLLRGYLTLIGAGTGKLPIPKACFSEFNPIFAKPGHRRLFCSQAPKKRSKKDFVYDRVFMSWLFSFLLIWLLRLWIIVVFLWCVLVDYENYYPKNKKETPRENNQKLQSKGTWAISGNFWWIGWTGSYFYNWKYVDVLNISVWVFKCFWLLWKCGQVWFRV